MKCDIVILSKSNSLLEKCLSALSMHTSLSSVGKVAIGWTGNESDLDLNMVGRVCTLPVQDIALGYYNFASNNNDIVRAVCSEEAVLFMNDDVVLVEDSISKCLSLLDAGNGRDVGTVGIKLLYPDGTIQHNGQFASFQAGRFVGVGHIEWKQPDFKAKGPRLVLGNTGAFLMCRREDFIAVGGFDTEFKHSLEDVKLNLEIMKLGRCNICNSTTWAWHAESQTRKQASCSEDMEHLRDYIEKEKDNIFKGIL